MAESGGAVGGLGGSDGREVKIMLDNTHLLKRITTRPEVFGGKPIIRDMRISVRLILSLMSQGVTQRELLEDYPELEPEDILACIAYAHEIVIGDSHADVSAVSS